MSAAPVMVPAPNGGADLFAIAENHNLLHAAVPTPAALATPAWENLGGSVSEVSAAYVTLAGVGTVLAVLAHGGPAGLGGEDKLYVRTRSANGWGDWIRLDALDVD